MLQAAGVTIASALAGCGGGGGGGGDEPDVTIDVGPGAQFEFDPDTVEVAVGESVEWVWQSNNHTVTPESIPEGAEWEGEPERHDSGYTYRHTFETAGTYEYYCEPHRGAGMVGSVIVGDGGGGNASE